MIGTLGFYGIYWFYITAKEMHEHQEEPYGGVPTLGMGLVFAKAREMGVPVPLNHLFDRLGIPIPAKGEKVLQK